MCPILVWSVNPDTAIVEAINGFGLRRLGWKGFEELRWVDDLLTRYPQIKTITLNTSMILGTKLAEVSQLFADAAPEDRPAIRSYFVGKLALEKLSCDLGGAGAGMCDKFGAFLKIFDLTRDLV